MPPGYAAITIWKVVVVRRRSASDARLLRHELAHVRQWRELGPLRFPYRYVKEYVAARRRGLGHWEAYRSISFEVEAERAALDPVTAPG